MLKQKKKTRRFEIVILLFLIASVFAGKVFLGQNKNVSVFGFSCYLVTSGSMQPSFPIGTLVIVQKKPFSSLKVGDPIAFESKAIGGKLAFHRIVKIEDGGVYTKGDSNPFDDNQKITKDTYVGTGRFQSYLLGKYILSISSPLGFIIYFILPILALYAFIISIKKLIYLWKS